MEGSPSLVSRTASLIPYRVSPYDRDEHLAQAARISAMFHDKTEKKARLPSVGERVSLRHKILGMSLFPNTHNKKFVMKYSDATS